MCAMYLSMFLNLANSFSTVQPNALPALLVSLRQANLRIFMDIAERLFEHD